MFWGLSPALDLQEKYYTHHKDNYEEIQILLIGGCDIRHVLKTLAQSYRHKPKRINIVIIEGCLELIARQLFLLSIALENPNHLGLLEKTRLFLEVYGNSLIRPVTSKYMIWKSNEMIKLISDMEFMKKILPNISIEELKYRERDYIEILLQFWRMGNTNQFNICDLWDGRIRRHLGCRYDAKSGVFDWDYNMRLKDIGGATVSSQEFKHFRSTGVAFTWLETEVCRPNYTLAAGVLKYGDEFIHRGYVGDIITGPFIGFSLDCEDEEMLRMSNRVHVKRATEISERNILRLMYELQFQKPFDSEIIAGIKNPDLGLATLVNPETKMSDESDSFSKIKYNSSDNPSLSLEFANVSFCSPTALKRLPLKEKFKDCFDIVYLSHNFVDKVDSVILNSVKCGGIVLIETKKFILDMKKDDIRAFRKDIEEFEKKCNCIPVQDYDLLKDAIVTLKKIQMNV